MGCLFLVLTESVVDYQIESPRGLYTQIDVIYADLLRSIPVGNYFYISK